MTSGHPDQASLLSGTAGGPRFGFEVNVRAGIRLREGKGVTLFYFFSLGLGWCLPS